ncbi:MAG: hypothetical protein ACFB11_24925 [Paracoccaceae bacterium]
MTNAPETENGRILSFENPPKAVKTSRNNTRVKNNVLEIIRQLEGEAGWKLRHSRALNAAKNNPGKTQGHALAVFQLCHDKNGFNACISLLRLT